MVKPTPRKGMQLFDADEALIGMIAGARGGTIVVGGRHIPKAAVARVTQNRAYLKPGADRVSEARAGAPAPGAVRPAGHPRRPAVRATRPPADAGAVRPLPGEQTYRALAAPTVVPLAAERLRAEKRPVDAGAVRVRKTVVAEEHHIPVDLTYETVRVEERALPVRPATAADLFSEGTIVVPLRGEEAVVTKEAVVTGEVVIAKEWATERHYVAETVRAEHAEVVTEKPVQRAALREAFGRGDGEPETRIAAPQPPARST
jgi:uncharacterized protein (TIGR02271 family)